MSAKPIAVRWLAMIATITLTVGLLAGVIIRPGARSVGVADSSNSGGMLGMICVGPVMWIPVMCI